MGFLDNIKRVFTGIEAHTIENTSNHHHQEPPDSFYIDSIEHNRAEKDRYFRTSPYSPIEDKLNFSGLSYYPPNPNLRFVLPLQRAEQPEELIFETSTGDQRSYYRIGLIEFEVENQPARLAVYQSPDYDELFLPFRDATTGKETYGAGRYLEPHQLANGNLLVDFNQAYNPFCAYSDSFSCPLPPFENWLKLPIRAGEKKYEKAGSAD
jgi:hypothetical protein